MLYACGECIYLSYCFDHCKRRRSFYQGHLSCCVRPASYSNAATTTMSNHHHHQQQQQQGTPAATGHTGGYPSPYNPPQQCAIQLLSVYPGISPLQSSMPPTAAAAAGGAGGVAGCTSTTTGRDVPGGGVAAQSAFDLRRLLIGDRSSRGGDALAAVAPCAHYGDRKP